MNCPPLVLLACALTFHTFGAAKVMDRFDRDITQRGIKLTDWEGQIANPALQYYLSAPSDMAYPVQAVMRVNNPRVYFEAARSQVSDTGPARNFSFADESFQEPFLVSIFPDHDTNDEAFTATVTYTGADQSTKTLTIPIIVHDQDRARTNTFNIIVDFSQEQTGFFDTPARRQIVQQAAADWAYFIDDNGFDEVAAYTELAFIWDKNGQNTGHRLFNSEPYRGFLLYVYGVYHPNLRSGGQGSWDGGLQSINGAATGLRRSGTYHADPRGNYNQLGWFLTQSDDDWWRTGNFIDEANDLASIAHHEIGHAFGFDQSYPSFAGSGGALHSDNLQNYFGDAPFNSNSHFNGLEDPASRKGVFGWEYYGTMVRRRWLITKLDLLCLEALGYKLRDTTPFQTLALGNPTATAARLSKPYNHNFQITGAVAPYHCEIQSGNLPPGIQIDSFTGNLAGTPTQLGTFQSTLKIRDSGNPQSTKTIPLGITVANEIRFTTTTRKLSQGFEAQITAGASPYVIENSTDLKTWTPIATNSLGGDYLFQDTTPATAPRFYRAIAR